MIKKILILLFCTIIFYSCGKKSDPEYKESNIVIFKSIISWWNIEIIIFTLKILIFDLYQIRLVHLFIVILLIDLKIILMSLRKTLVKLTH